MRRSPLLTVLAFVAIGIGGCATRQPKIPPPLYTMRSGSLMLARSIQPIAIASLPTNFTIDSGRAPVWLNQGSEIGVFGTADHKSLMLGLSGPEYTNVRTIAEDFSAAAQHGKLLDIMASPDGMTIANAFAIAGENRVEIIARDIVDPGAGRPIASFDGSFDSAELRWLAGNTLAVSLKDRDKPGRELYMVTVAGQPQTRSVNRIGCTLTKLNFSPDGQWAVAQGDNRASPFLVNLREQSCVRIDRRESIRVLAWAPDDSSFLYVAHGAQSLTGVFRYDRGSGHSVVIAISSGAAAYASDGTIVALGSSHLSWRNAAAFPNKLIQLQIARWIAGQEEIQINSIGVGTLPSMLAEASMVFSTISNEGVIDLAIPSPQGAQRELVGYSYPARTAFLLASGNAGAPIAMGWSPDGKLLAIVDGGVRPALLMVVAPR